MNHIVKHIQTKHVNCPIKGYWEVEGISVMSDASGDDIPVATALYKEDALFIASAYNKWPKIYEYITALEVQIDHAMRDNFYQAFDLDARLFDYLPSVEHHLQQAKELMGLLELPAHEQEALWRDESDSWGYDGDAHTPGYELFLQGKPTD